MSVQQDILIDWSPQETRGAVIEQGAVQELAGLAGHAVGLCRHRT